MRRIRALSAFLFALLLTVPMPANAAATPAQAASSTNDAPLRVVIVGLVHGHVEGFFDHNLHRKDIQIVGIEEPDHALFARYAKQFGLNEDLYFSSLDTMLSRQHPEAALVYTSPLAHRAAVEICARHHVDVMMEKPLATTVADALAMQRIAKQAGIQVLVNYETSWYASNHDVYDLVQQHALGRVFKVVAHDGHRGPKEIGVQPEFLKWLTDPRQDGGGALFDFGCYGADLMTWLMHGQRPLTVTAVTMHIKPEIYPHVDDDSTVIVTYPKAEAILEPSWNWPFDRKDIEVYGKTGYAITVGTDRVRLRTAGQATEIMEAAPALTPPYADSLTYLTAVVRGRIQPDVLSSIDTNVIVTEILCAARESAQTGKTVHL
ncbi:MAG TPA: Gfo/Idh/MocA family oxidoreductase [Acidobacteriaceae bacterium]|nr:Gfo/Idh/MocA family oxidoreductase [Acidobacteriaceae bacterium]